MFIKKIISIFVGLGIVAMMAACGGKKKKVKNDASNKKAPSAIKVIAHRGASYAAPENTMAAVNLAWKKGADMVEIDVYLTADDRVMVIHDATTGRTGDKDLKVKESTSEELRTVDVGSFKGEKFKGAKIPFLKEVIASVPEGKQLFIEIKGTGEAIPFIKDAIEGSGKKEQMVIIGFNLKTVTNSKKAMPQIPVYWVQSTPFDTDIIQKAKKHGLDGVDVNYEGLTKEFVAACRKANMDLYVWTVDEKAAIKKMAKLGVDGITTNRVDLTKSVLKGEG